MIYDNLEKAKTINVQSYASMLRELKKAIIPKRRNKQRVGVLLLPVNAPIYTAQVVVAEIVNCGFELLPHTSYSLDSAPSDFLFPKHKFHLPVHHFGNNHEVIRTVEEFWGSGIPPSSVMGLQCLSINTLISRRTILKNNEKLSGFSDFFWGSLRTF